MILKELKSYFESFVDDYVFDWSLSDPFSWRGSYDEVAFALLKQPSTKESNLKKIKKAYSDSFYGYKGGEYEFDDCTNVNFENCSASWSDGKYVQYKIAEIENSSMYESEEHRLVSLAFK